ncbi:MAG: hypothetical protein WCB15_21535, partial [Desulfobacterales bacterium]
MTCGNIGTSIRSALIIMSLTVILFSGCSVKNHTQMEREKRMQSSPQFKEGKFVNPIEAPMMAPGSTWKYIKKSYFSKRIDPKPTGKL